MSMAAQRSPVDVFIDQAQEALELLRSALHEVDVASDRQTTTARILQEEVGHHLTEHSTPSGPTAGGD